jgi:hypothetical protein
MTTPAIILVLLAVPLLVMTILGRVNGRKLAQDGTVGCIGVCLVFCFTGVGHFIKTGPMAEMLPRGCPVASHLSTLLAPLRSPLPC